MPANSKPVHASTFILLGLIVVLAVALRIHDLTLRSLSNDELGTLETTAGRGQIHLTLPRNVVLLPAPLDTTMEGAEPVWRVPMVMGSDVHPPLFFVLLRFWQDVFGNGDGASRGMSVLFGTLSVLAIYDVGRLLDGVTTGLWAAVLMAVAQPQIGESQEARPYALGIFLLLGAVDALLRVLRKDEVPHHDPLSPRRPRGKYIALVVLLAAVCLTHYFVLPAIVAMGIYVVVQGKPKVLIAFAIAGGLVLVLWGAGMWQQRGNFSDPWMYWMVDIDPHPMRATLMRMAELPIRFLAEPIAGSSNAIAGVVYLLPWLMCGRRKEMVLLGAWMIGCAGLPFVLDLLRGTNQLVWIKYSLLAAPALYLMLPMIARGWAGHFIAGAAVLFCAINLPAAYSPLDSGYKAVAADLEKFAKPDQMVVFCGSGWGEWYTGDLYMGVEHYSRRMPSGAVLLKAPLPAEWVAKLADAARQTGGLWFVEWTNHPPQDLLPGWEVEKTVSYKAAVELHEMMPP